MEAQSAVITEDSVLFSCPGTFLLLFSVLDRKPRNLDSNKERIFKPTGASPVAIMMYLLRKNSPNTTPPGPCIPARPPDFTYRFTHLRMYTRVAPRRERVGIS